MYVRSVSGISPDEELTSVMCTSVYDRRVLRHKTPGHNNKWGYCSTNRQEKTPGILCEKSIIVEIDSGGSCGTHIAAERQRGVLAHRIIRRRMILTGYGAPDPRPQFRRVKRSGKDIPAGTGPGTASCPGQLSSCSCDGSDHARHTDCGTRTRSNTREDFSIRTGIQQRRVHCYVPQIPLPL